MLFLVALGLQGQSWAVATETMESSKPEIFLSVLVQREFADCRQNKIDNFWERRKKKNNKTKKSHRNILIAIEETEAKGRN